MVMGVGDLRGDLTTAGGVGTVDIGFLSKARPNPWPEWAGFLI